MLISLCHEYMLAKRGHCNDLNAFFTLFVRISTEDCESWDMECLSTPLGGLGKDGGKDGERGGDMLKGGPPS